MIFPLGSMLLAVALLAGCSKKTDFSDIDRGDEIRLSAGMSKIGEVVSKADLVRPTRGEGVIRAARTEDLEVAFARIDEGVSGYPADYSAASALNATWKGTLSETDATAIVFATKQYYQTNGNNTKMVGWYPRTTSFTGGVATIAIDGDTDIMLTQELEANKATASRFGKTGKIFNFKHQLTWIKISAYAKDDDAKARWGKITSITVKDQPEACEITLPATVDFATESKDIDLVAKKFSDYTAIDYSDGLEVGVEASETEHNKVECGYAMVAPVAEDGTFKLELETSDYEGSKTISVTLPTNADSTVGFKAGSAYEIVLVFTVSEITPTATITDWIEVPDPVVVPL